MIKMKHLPKSKDIIQVIQRPNFLNIISRMKWFDQTSHDKHKESIITSTTCLNFFTLHQVYDITLHQNIKRDYLGDPKNQLQVPPFPSSIDVVNWDICINHDLLAFDFGGLAFLLSAGGGSSSISLFLAFFSSFLV